MVAGRPAPLQAQGADLLASVRVTWWRTRRCNLLSSRSGISTEKVVDRPRPSKSCSIVVHHNDVVMVVMMVVVMIRFVHDYGWLVFDDDYISPDHWCER
jgi:hypothetical protein